MPNVSSIYEGVEDVRGNIYVPYAGSSRSETRTWADGRICSAEPFIFHVCWDPWIVSKGRKGPYGALVNPDNSMPVR